MAPEVMEQVKLILPHPRTLTQLVITACINNAQGIVNKQVKYAEFLGVLCKSVLLESPRLNLIRLLAETFTAVFSSTINPFCCRLKH